MNKSKTIPVSIIVSLSQTNMPERGVLSLLTKHICIVLGMLESVSSLPFCSALVARESLVHLLCSFLGVLY